MQRLRLLAVMAICAQMMGGCRNPRPRPAAAAARRPAVELPAPISRRSPTVVDGARIVVAEHFGASLPARGALEVGEQTWLATPSGIVRVAATSSDVAARKYEVVGIVDVRAGLSSSSVNALWRRGGQILAAVDDGVFRLTADGGVDGPVGLRGIRSTALAPPLVGTWRGLYRLGQRQPRPVAGTEHLQVTALLRCGDSVFVGTHAAGLHRYRGGKIAQVPGLPTTARVGDLSGCSPTWAATTSGLFRVDGAHAAGVLIESWKRHATTVEAFSDRVVVGTFGEGVFELSLRDGAVDWVAHSGRVSLLARVGGRLLVGTEDRVFFPGDDREIALDGPPPGLITALAHDGQHLWAGSFDGGLGVHQSGRWRPVRLKDQRVTALAADRLGRVWIGTARGLMRATSDVDVTSVEDPRGWLRDRHINALRAHDGNIIASAYPGIVAITVAEQGELEYNYLGATGKDSDAGISSPTVYGVAARDDALWLATTAGATQLLRTASERPRQARWLSDIDGVLPDNVLNDVRATRSAVHLLTLRDGLLTIDRRGTTVWRLQLMTSPSVLRAIDDDTLLFGTNARGLALLENNGASSRVVTYGPQQGLSSSLVGSLLVDSARGRLWIGGNGGIDRIDNYRDVLEEGRR